VKRLASTEVVRLLIGHDSQQTPIAEQAFLAVTNSGGVYLPDVVLIAAAQEVELPGGGAELLNAGGIGGNH
jgi:predicted nucleic-acid-binding protein